MRNCDKFCFKNECLQKKIHFIDKGLLFSGNQVNLSEDVYFQNKTYQHYFQFRNFLILCFNISSVIVRKIYTPQIKFRFQTIF